MGETPPTTGGVKPDINNNNNTNNNNNSNKPSKGKKNNKSGKSSWKPSEPSVRTITFSGSRQKDITGFTVFLASLIAYANKIDSYAGQSIEEGEEVLPEELEESDYGTRDADVDVKLSEFARIRFSNDHKQWTSEVKKTKEALRRTYAVARDNCDSTVLAALREDPSFDEMNKKRDVITLIKKLESLAYKGATTSEPIYSLGMMIREFFTLGQGDAKLDEFYESFNDLKTAVDNICGGTDKFLGSFDDILTAIRASEEGEKVASLNDAQKKVYAKEGRDRLEAVFFLLSVSKKAYGDSTDQLKQDFLKGNKSYPKSIQSAFQLLRSVKVKEQPRNNGNPNSNRSNDKSGGGDGHQFNTNGDVDNDNSTPCERCGRTNHKTSDCRAKYHADGTVLHMNGTITENIHDEDAEIEGEDTDDAEHII